MLAKLLLRPVEIDFRGSKIKVADIKDLSAAMAAAERLQELSRDSVTRASDQQKPR